MPFFLKYRLDKYSSCQDTVAEPLWLNLLLFICLFLSEEMKYCCNQKQHVWLKRKKVPSMFEPGNKEKSPNVCPFFLQQEEEKLVRSKKVFPPLWF